MPHFVQRVLLVAGITVSPLPALAQFVVDVGQPPGTTTQSIPAGTSVSVAFRNLAPAASYEIAVLRQTLEVPPLDAKTTGSVLLGVVDECEALTTAKGLTRQADEAKVAAAVSDIEAKRKDCVSDEQRQIDLFVGATRRTIDVGVISAGEEVRITIVRKGEPPKTWALTLTAGARGRWRTLYGVALGPGQSDKYFAQPGSTAGQFVLAKEREDANEQSDLAVIPAAFFQWLPLTRELKDWAVGPTLGLGVKSDRPAFFVGGIVTFNQNLGLVVGVPVYQQLKLRGNYSEGQVISENLNEDQLHKKVYRFQRFFFGGVFRFGSNPFAGGESGSNGGSTGLFN